MSNPAYTVVINRSAQKEIRSLDAAVRTRIIRAIRLFAAEPRPPGCRKLVGSQNRWRVRVGDYRIIYLVDDTGRVIEVVAVRHRSRAYE